MENITALIGGNKNTYSGMFIDIELPSCRKIEEAALVEGDTDITRAYGIPTMKGMIVFIGNDTGEHSGRIKVKLNKGKGKAVRNLKSEDYYTAGADDNGTTVNFRGGKKVV